MLVDAAVRHRQLPREAVAFSFEVIVGETLSDEFARDL